MELLEPAELPLEPRPTGCPVPLTAFQLRYWGQLAKQEEPLSVRMCAASVRISGPLNTCLLRGSIEAVMQRHESLRTRIVPVDGIPRQHIDAACDAHFEVIDLAKAPPINVDREAQRFALKFVEKKIDLSVGPLFEVKLLRLSRREHVLIVALDHIVSDAVSCVILSREMWTAYNQAVQGVPISLPQVPIQFADYAVWQHRTYDAWLKKHQTYWKGRLTGAPRTNLPYDYALTEGKHATWAVQYFPIGRKLRAELCELARREQALLSLLVLTVYVAVLSRWCNQRDFVLTFVSHGRHRSPQLENMIGCLATILHFRMEINNEHSFLDLLKRVNQEFYFAYQHHDFDRVPDFIPECVDELQFNWIPTTWTERFAHENGQADGHVGIQPFPIQAGDAGDAGGWPAKLAPDFCDTGAGIVVTVWYRSDLFAPSTIERFGRSLRWFAETFTQRPLAPIASVTLVS
jgi:hypothetical protein